MILERLSTFHKSTSNITHSAIASQDRSACVLHTVQHALTAYSLLRQPVHALHVVVRPCINCILYYCTTSTCGGNENASRALVPQYKNVNAVVNLRMVRKCCQTSCTTYLYSTVVYHCHTALSPLRWWISTHCTINLSVPVPALDAFSLIAHFSIGYFTTFTPDRNIV